MWYEPITIFSVLFQLMAGFEPSPNHNNISAEEDENKDFHQTSFEAKPKIDLSQRMVERSGFKPPSLNTNHLIWPPDLLPNNPLLSPVALSFDRAKNEYFDEIPTCVGVQSISRSSLAPRIIGDDSQDNKPVTGLGDSVANDAPEDDGYSWRKYGQKLVKGCKYPRSYYKCTTNQTCHVKKKVERSQEGYITIIYTGIHNHPIARPHCRSGIGSYSPSLDMRIDGIQRTQQGFTGNNVSDRGKHSYGTNFGSMQVQDGTQFVYGNAAANAFSRYEGEVDESESKRRKHQVYGEEMSGTGQAGREKKVVVDTTTEIEILDDGYRWRKYGQKVVKGNPNPRSYYKCTDHGCAVTKHVERSSDDLKSVLTTYIGVHNHDAPPERNSGHISSGSRTGFFHGCFADQTQDHPMQYPVPYSTSEGLVTPNSSLFDFPPHLKPPGFSYIGQTGLSGFPMPGLANEKEKLPSLPEPTFGDPAGLMLQLGAEPKVELPMSEPGLEMSRSSLTYKRFPEI